MAPAKVRIVVRGNASLDLERFGEVVSIGDREIAYVNDAARAAEVVKEALQKGLKAEVSSIALEDVFIKLVGGGLGMKALRDALILAWMKVYPALRHNQIEIIFVLIITGGLPLFFLAIFWGQEQIPHGLVGAFVTSAALLAVYTAAQDLIWDNQSKLRQILVAKPITPLSYALGTALSALLYSLPGLLIFGGILLYRGVLPPLALPLAFLAMLAAWAAMSTLGFTISTYFLNASPFRVNAVTNIIAFGAAFISPVYYPADLLGTMAWTALLTPLSAAASIIRALAGLTGVDWLWPYAWLSLAAQALLFSLLVIVKAQWRET